MSDCPITPPCDARVCDICGDIIDSAAPTCSIHDRCNNHPTSSSGCRECHQIALDAMRYDADMTRGEGDR